MKKIIAVMFNDDQFNWSSGFDFWQGIIANIQKLQILTQSIFNSLILYLCQR